MKIRMIYLAAGNSRRFGSNKLLYKIDGKPLFSYGLDVLIKVLEEREDTSLTVVTNFAEVAAYAAAGRQRICREREGLSGKGSLWQERISIVQSPYSHKGISHSIRAGLLGPGKDAGASFDTEVTRQPGRGSGILCAPGPDADYYLFCVADQPYINEKTIISLIQKTAERGYIGGFVEWEGKSGNPVVFSKELFGELLALEGDRGGKKLLAGRENVCRVRAGRREEMEDVDYKKCENWPRSLTRFA